MIIFSPSNDDYERLSCFLPSELYGCVFVGHKATDLDSIASAVGCAELFHGVAARASNVNSESKFALEYWSIPTPLPFLDVVKADSRVCIVDHNQAKQCPDGINFGQVVGCIDHHAMQGNTISTSTPIHVDIKPWGSACTIVAHMFFRAKRKITRKTAGMLLSGILSDTLNLRSPTTTEHDGLAVALLSKLADVSNTNDLARSLFKAKSQELLMCTPHQLVRGDIKTFECRCPNTKTISISFGVIETTDVSGLINIRDELAMELRALKKEEKKDVAFLAFVDIVNLSSYLLLVGSRETHLAKTVFKGEVDPVTGLMNLPNLVSRKKDFIPPLERAIADGYELPTLSAEEANQAEKEEFGEVSLECGEHGCQTVRQPCVASSASIAQRFVETFRSHAHSHSSRDSGSSTPSTSEGQSSPLCSTMSLNIGLSITTLHSNLASPVVEETTSTRKRTIDEVSQSSEDNSQCPTFVVPAPIISHNRQMMKRISSEPSLQLSRSSTPLRESLQDPATAPFVEEAIKHLVDTMDLENVKRLIDPSFTLPTAEEYHDTLNRIANSDDQSLKFLVMAFAHSFEKEDLDDQSTPVELSNIARGPDSASSDPSSPAL